MFKIKIKPKFLPFLSIFSQIAWSKTNLTNLNLRLRSFPVRPRCACILHLTDFYDKKSEPD